MRPGDNWKLPLKEYLKTDLLTTEEKQVLFSLRCREYDVKTNYKNKYEEDMTCRICREEESEEDELHTFFKCKILTHDIKIDPKTQFNHVFGSLKEQVNVMKHIMLVTRKRNIILEIRPN